MPDADARCVGAAAAVAALVALSLGTGPQVAAAPTSIAGAIVFLDPGQSGGNDASISRQVPDGRGGTKDCQAAGATTPDGYPDHSLTWDVVLRIRAALDQLGVRTAMSRGSDNAPGPCVDERAAMANALHPDAIVSIHADNSPATGRGFHVSYPIPPLNTAQAGPTVQLARVVRDQLAASGVPASNYVGTDGVYGRADLPLLNLAQYPAVQIDVGNVKNPLDSGLMTTEEGRAKYAAAVVNGIAGFLGARQTTINPAR